MWKVPIIFHHPQLPYISNILKIFKAWWYTSVWAEDIWYTYDSYTIQSIMQISKKQKRDKRRKTQERCGVLLIRLFSSWTSGAVWQVSAWLSEGKHIRYNNFLGISNDHTLFIHVNSTTSEHLQQKMQQQKHTFAEWSTAIRNKSGSRWNNSLFNISSVLAFQQNHAKPLYKSVPHLVGRKIPCIAVHRGSTYVRTTGRGFTL